MMRELIALRLVILLIAAPIKTTSCLPYSFTRIIEIAKKFGCEYNIESHGIFLLCDRRQSSKYETTDIKLYFKTSEKNLMVRAHQMPPDELLLLLKILRVPMNDSVEYVFTHLEIHETKLEKSHWDLISTITNLETLAVESCEVSELPIESLNQLINLKQLYLRHNQIYSLNGSLKLPNLEIFNAHDNNIRNISNNFFKNCPRLKSIYLSKNKIKDLNPNVCSEYTIKLNLDYNNIDNIDSSFAKTCESIKELSLIKNSLEVIHSGSFPEFLKTLFFSNNTKTIKYFPRCAFPSEIPDTINLNGNVFHCSCDLQWIKEHNVDNLHSLKCKDATGTKPFTRVEFCEKINNFTSGAIEIDTTSSWEETTSSDIASISTEISTINGNVTPSPPATTESSDIPSTSRDNSTVGPNGASTEMSTPNATVTSLETEDSSPPATTDPSKEKNTSDIPSTLNENFTVSPNGTSLETTAGTTTNSKTEETTPSDIASTPTENSTPSANVTPMTKNPSIKSNSTLNDSSTSSETTPGSVSNSTTPRPSLEKREKKKQSRSIEVSGGVIGGVIAGVIGGVIVIIPFSIYIVWKIRRKIRASSVDINAVRRRSSDVVQDVEIPMAEINPGTSSENHTEKSTPRTYNMININNCLYNLGTHSGQQNFNFGPGTSPNS